MERDVVTLAIGKPERLQGKVATLPCCAPQDIWVFESMSRSQAGIVRNASPTGKS